MLENACVEALGWGSPDVDHGETGLCNDENSMATHHGGRTPPRNFVLLGWGMEQWFTRPPAREITIHATEFRTHSVLSL
jgi:hypothetical protein